MAEYYGLNPNLAGAGASAPTYNAQDYPLSSDKKRSLPLWLDSLTRVTARNTPDFHMRGCTCCNYPNTHQPFTDYSLASLERKENWLLKLPCGCTYRRGCVVEMMKERDNCLYCGFQLFKQWTLHGYVKDLPTADLVKERKRGKDAECGICQREFDDQHVHPENSSGFTQERPITLPCSHVYGEECLRKWLSPASKGGGNANTCPSCRKVLFPPWPPTRETLAYVGLDDEDEDDDDGSSVSSWDDSSVLGEEVNVRFRPATQAMRPPMPSVREEEDEDIAPVHVETRTRRPYAVSGEDIAPSHATTRTRRPRDSTALDREDIAPSRAETRTRRSYASRGEQIAQSRTTTRTRRSRESDSDEEDTTSLATHARRRAWSGISDITLPFSVRRPGTNERVSLNLPQHRHLLPLRQHLNLPTEKERLLRMEERAYWGHFVTNYSRIMQLNPTKTLETSRFAEELMGSMDELYDYWCDETPEERADRRDDVKDLIYEKWGKPRFGSMNRLESIMWAYEDGEDV